MLDANLRRVRVVSDNSGGIGDTPPNRAAICGRLRLVP